MTRQLRAALERLDLSIDRLEEKAQAIRSAPKASKSLHGGARNRTEVLGKLDGVIGRLETFLSSEAETEKPKPKGG